MTDPDRARQLRRRHMHERQAVVFGVLIAALAVIGLGAAAVYTGSLDLAFMDEEIRSKPTPTVKVVPYPCPPEGALPVAYAKIAINVYNGTTTVGLAGTTADDLTTRGFTIASTGNQKFDGSARITFGPAGVAAAYTLRAHVTDAVMTIDARQDATIDLTVGEEFLDLVPADQVKLDLEQPLESPKDCTPYSEIVKPAEPTAAPTA